MTLRTLAILAMALGGSTMAAPVPKELQAKSDLERMQGLWTWQAYGDDGALEKFHGTTWFFKKDKMYSAGRKNPEDTDVVFDIVLRLEKSPSQIDMFFCTNGVQHGRGIYKFEGDELHIAERIQGERPTDFSPGIGITWRVLKRVPKPKK